MYTVSSQYQNQATSQSIFSSSPSVTMISSFVQRVFGLSYAKPTKRTLSEEAECGVPESLSEWLRKGSNPNEVDAYGYTPLVNASLRGCARSARFLLENGADVDKRAMHGYTALHAASQNGHLNVCEVLVEFGANLEARNDDDDTPLMLAVRAEHPAVADFLCTKGCNLHVSGFDKMDPISYAMSKRNLYMSDVLIKHESRQNLNSTSSSVFNDSSYTTSSLLPNQSDSVFHSEE